MSCDDKVMEMVSQRGAGMWNAQNIDNWCLSRGDNPEGILSMIYLKENILPSTFST